MFIYIHTLSVFHWFHTIVLLKIYSWYIQKMFWYCPSLKTLAMAQLYKPLVGERSILLARVQIKSFWQGIFQPAILLARIQSLSACWTRKPPTAFHRHPYVFSDQGWFSHLVMIGQASMPSSLHSLQMDVLSSKIWPVPICWHQTPLPYGPQRDLVTPVKLNWTYLFPLPK